VRELAPHAAVEIFEGGHGWTPAYIGRQTVALDLLGARMRAEMRP